MTKLWFGTVISAAALAATPAMAQTEADFYVGGQAGYHDLGDNPLGGDDGGGIVGVYGGVDVPVGESLVLGVEGNWNRGTNAIDYEYGIAGKVGVRAGDRAQLFVRGGYQEVDVDLGNVFRAPVPAGTDDTDGDYLVGAGAQYMLNENLSLRGVVDTIEFDTVRATAGLAYHF